MTTCKWNESWVGICGKPADELGFCEEHKGRVCVCCGETATRTCEHTGVQFVCGAYLCNNCSHGVPDLKDPGFLGMGGGHHPNHEVEEMMEKEYGITIKTEPEKIREAYHRKTGKRGGSIEETDKQRVNKENVLLMNGNMVGANINKQVVNVNHNELTRFGDGIYKSECPECKEGLLLVGRNQETLILEEYDYCVLCGQSFRYLDIETMRERENGGE
jgi:hypothetical protein